MDQDFKIIADQLKSNFDAMLNKVNTVIEQIPEEKRNETLANKDTINEIKQAVQSQNIDKLNEILKKCQSQL